MEQENSNAMKVYKNLLSPFKMPSNKKTSPQKKASNKASNKASSKKKISPEKKSTKKKISPMKSQLILSPKLDKENFPL